MTSVAMLIGGHNDAIQMHLRSVLEFEEQLAQVCEGRARSLFEKSRGRSPWCCGLALFSTGASFTSLIDFITDMSGARCRYNERSYWLSTRALFQLIIMALSQKDWKLLNSRI